jgi:predicted anti-sigma-YlaC factor YlaD
MTCRAWQHLWNDALDGDPSALEQHLRSCPECAPRAPALTRLNRGLASLRPPPAPAGLAGRITARAVSDARRRRRLRRVGVFAGLAAAACLLVAAGVIWWPSAPPSEVADTEPVTPKRKAPAAEPLRASVARAGSAVAALTNRTASATVGETAALLPLMGPGSFDASLPPETPLPPVEPLQEASEGVSAGLAPVADSARRAFGRFFRDLPGTS